MTNNSKLKLKISFALGYFLSLINEYFTFVSVKGMLRFDNSRIVKKSLVMLLNFEKEYRLLLGEEIIIFPNMKTSENIIEYLECFFEYVKEKVNKNCSSMEEMAFYLGGLISVTEISGPSDFETGRLLEILNIFFNELNADCADFDLENLIEEFNSYNLEKRRIAREIILFLIYEEDFVMGNIELISEIERVINNSVY